MIEVCIATFQRTYRLPALLDRFRNQTNQDFNINIWNNTGRELHLNFPRLKVYNSPENIGSQARFRLVPETNGETIIFLDDDETIDDDFIEYYYNEHLKKPNAILGWFTKRWEDEGYWNATSVRPPGEEVDYVGTGGMILGREIFDEDKTLQKIPREYAKVEDLYLCYRARERGMKLYSIEPKCYIIPDIEDQYIGLVNYKHMAFKSLRKKGWKLLKDA